MNLQDVIDVVNTSLHKFFLAKLNKRACNQWLKIRFIETKASLMTNNLRIFMIK